jgi:hypothetical protein
MNTLHREAYKFNAHHPERKHSVRPSRKVPFTGLTLAIGLAVVILFAISGTSCGKPQPTRVVQFYLEEIGKPNVSLKRIEKYTTEAFREDLLNNSIITEIIESGGNYYNLFSQLMSEDDIKLVQEEYDFDIGYNEVTNENLAQVKVYIRPMPKRGVKVEKSLESETLHPILIDILGQRQPLEFWFKLRNYDGEWKIEKITYPGALSAVITERGTATVTIPMPVEIRPVEEEVETDDT